jgi:hypothetical protein
MREGNLPVARTRQEDFTAGKLGKKTFLSPEGPIDLPSRLAAHAR